MEKLRGIKSDRIGESRRIRVVAQFEKGGRVRTGDPLRQALQRLNA